MPYIPQEERKQLDPLIQQLVEQIVSMTGKDLSTADGRLNYTICKLLIGVLDLEKNPKYHKFNTAAGVLECVKTELYRILAAPYEEEKIAENGHILAPKWITDAMRAAKEGN